MPRKPLLKISQFLNQNLTTFFLRLSFTTFSSSLLSPHFLTPAPPSSVFFSVLWHEHNRWRKFIQNLVKNSGFCSIKAIAWQLMVGNPHPKIFSLFSWITKILQSFFNHLWWHNYSLYVVIVHPTRSIIRGYIYIYKWEKVFMLNIMEHTVFV